VADKKGVCYLSAIYQPFLLKNSLSQKKLKKIIKFTEAEKSTA